MNKITLGILLFLTVSFSAVAGGPSDGDKIATIKGTVTDDKGEPITGAVVVIEGTDKKVYTDFDGNFEITAPKTKQLTLKVSSVAYKEEKIVLKNIQSVQTSAHIKLRKKVKYSR